MQTRRTTTKLSGLALALGILASVWSVLGATRAEAVIAIIRTTGLFSLAPGQVASSHVVNTGEERGFVDSEGPFACC